MALEEYPPSDPASSADMLLEQMDSLCHDIDELQGLVKTKRPRNGESKCGCPSTSSGFGDHSPLTARRMEAKDTVAAILGPQVPPPPVSNQVGLFDIILRHLKYVAIFFCFLLLISCLLALFVDQDLIDPYIDKYLGGTVFENFLNGVRNNWQIPLQREFRCISSYFPIYKSRRSRFWEILYSTVLPDHKVCDPTKSFVLSAQRFLGCLVACHDLTRCLARVAMQESL